MIKYHYSILEDIKAYLRVVWYWRWLRKERIQLLWPRPFKIPKIDYQCDKDITCYWVSGGVWGSYKLPDKIYVCPRGDTERIIKHEIAHLEHEHEVQGMTHSEKEEYIEMNDRR